MSEAVAVPNADIQSHVIGALMASGIDPDLLALKLDILHALDWYRRQGSPPDPAELTRHDEIKDLYVRIERMQFGADALTVTAQVWDWPEWARYHAGHERTVVVPLHGEPWDNSDAWGFEEAATWGEIPTYSVCVWLGGEPRNIVALEGLR